MKRLLNVDEEWLAGIQNCPPQGNLGGGVDEVVDLEAVARMEGRGSGGKLSLPSPFPNLQVGGGVDEVFNLEAVARRWLGDLCRSGVELV